MTSEKNWYDRWYKLMLVIPVLLLVVSGIYLYSFHARTGDLIIRDNSLAGGTTITVLGDFDSQAVEQEIQNTISDAKVRRISDSATLGSLGIIVESSSNPEELEAAVESVLGVELNEDNSSIEFSGATLGESFYRQLIIALIASFILMSIVIFFLFRTLIPGIAVIFAALADIVMPLALINYLGISLSAAGIAAFLMLIGYSVDSDILLTTRVLRKKEGSLNERIFGSFKTGMFMTTTAFLAVIPAFILPTGLRTHSDRYF
jgi:preprotein translocase subunit SecF